MMLSKNSRTQMHQARLGPLISRFHHLNRNKPTHYRNNRSFSSRFFLPLLESIPQEIALLLLPLKQTLKKVGLDGTNA